MNFDDMFVDTRDVLEKIGQLNLCSYFLETRKRAKLRSAMSWLESCDDDTIKMIRQYSEKITKGEETIVKNNDDDVFDTNPQMAQTQEGKFRDKFENDLDDENEDEIKVDDNCDYYALVCLLLAWEHDSRKVPMDIIDEAFFALALYANMEEMRRDGLVKVKGSGTLLSQNTKFALTSAGKKFGKSLMKVINGTKKEK